MGKVAILTDSNSGITQAQSKELGVKVIPMPFFIDGEQYFEDINLTQEEFYGKLKQDADISTSQPSIGEMQDAFDELLKEYDELVYIFLCQAVLVGHARQLLWWLMIMMERFRLSITREFL